MRTYSTGYNSGYVAGRRAERQRLGLCIDCPREARDGTRCTECAARHTEAQQARDEAAQLPQAA